MSAREDLASYADRYGYTDEVNSLIDAYCAEVLREAAQVALVVASIQDEHCAKAAEAVAAELNHLADQAGAR